MPISPIGLEAVGRGFGWIGTCLEVPERLFERLDGEQYAVEPPQPGLTDTGTSTGVPVCGEGDVAANDDGTLFKV